MADEVSGGMHNYYGPVYQTPAVHLSLGGPLTVTGGAVVRVIAVPHYLPKVTSLIAKNTRVTSQ